MCTGILNIVLMLSLLLLEVYSQQCSKLSSPKGGRVIIRAQGRVARFRCSRKSTLYGSKILVCSGGEWSKPPPICINSGCEQIKPGKGMKLTTAEKGALNQFECEAPLNLVGNKILTCDGEQWSGPVPTCESMVILDIEPKVFCDFEDRSLCGWKHDTTAENEWIWGHGTTPTRRTGPSYDHTFGKDAIGHYIFMESSLPAKEGESARLLSLFYGPTAVGKCFQFWYHLFGQAGPERIGRLTIYIEEIGKPKIGMFTISENQGDLWIKGIFPIGKREEPFRFVIEATRMKSYLGDISVDDTEIVNCTKDFTMTTDAVDETTTNELTTQRPKMDGETTQSEKMSHQSTEYVETMKLFTTPSRKRTIFKTRTPLTIKFIAPELLITTSKDSLSEMKTVDIEERSGCSLNKRLWKGIINIQQTLNNLLLQFGKYVTVDGRVRAVLSESHDLNDLLSDLISKNNKSTPEDNVIKSTIEQPEDRFENQLPIFPKLEQNSLTENVTGVKEEDGEYGIWSPENNKKH